MKISHKIQPERAVELIEIVLGELETEHPAFLELSLLSGQIEEQAKLTAVSQAAADNTREKLRDVIRFVEGCQLVMMNQWSDDDLAERLARESIAVIRRARDEGLLV